MKKKNPGPNKGKKHTDVVRSEFGERLFRTRKSRGLSQTELGEKVSLSKRMISYYEGNPQEGPPLQTLTRIADALGVTVSYLLGESTLKAIKNDVPAHLRQAVKALENMPPKEQRKVVEYIELLAKKSDARKKDAA